MNKSKSSENIETKIISDPNGKQISKKSKKLSRPIRRIRKNKLSSSKYETNTIEDDVDTGDKGAEVVVENNIKMIPDNDSKAVKEVPTTSNSHSLSNKPLQTEEDEEEEEYDENEVEKLRSILAQMQVILLFIAAVTFLCILIYAVYYINLIRKIYADKELISK